jgi:hypothetical protein
MAAHLLAAIFFVPKTQSVRKRGLSDGKCTLYVRKFKESDG